MSNELTHDRLLQLLSYEESTGIFRWKEKRYYMAADSIAGTRRGLGYIAIRIQGQSYYAHRLAIFYITGSMPETSMDVDHINGIRIDNAYKNLRVVTHQTNQENRIRANRRSTGRSSKYLGVSWKKEKQLWVANIGLSGKQKHLGYFDDEEAAHFAYIAAKRIHHGGCLI